MNNSESQLDSVEYSDTDDIVVEEEKIIYLNELNNEKSEETNTRVDPIVDLIENCTTFRVRELSFHMSDDDNDMIIEEESIVYTQQSEKPSTTTNTSSLTSIDAEPLQSNIPKENSNECLASPTKKSPERLRFKGRYSKLDPNIILEFCQNECTIKALKILFDWLKMNCHIVENCYSSNPEFVHKIMKLMNYLNIDMFSRKIFFDLKLIKSKDVRTDLRSLFDIRVSIPLEEDVLLKDFPLFEAVQHDIDFEIPLQMSITKNEENIIRVLKLVDIGFILCKTKKFRYNFCARTRQFIEQNTQRERKRGRGRDKRKNNRRERRFKQFKNDRKQREPDENNFKILRNNDFKFELVGKNDDRKMENGRSMAVEPIQPNKETIGGLPKKGYLKNRYNQNTTTTTVPTTMTVEEKIEPKKTVTGENKYEIMGELWLRNEVKTLESKIKKPINNFTPYLVVDAKSLADYTTIVKNLIKTKKFVVLIPNAGKIKIQQF